MPECPRPEEVRGPEDALKVIFATRQEKDTLVVLLMHDDSGAAISFDNAETEDVKHVLQAVCEAAPAHPGNKIVLGQFREHVDADVTEMARWFEASDLASTYGVKLVDWFLIAEDRARSMAETTFSEDRW